MFINFREGGKGRGRERERERNTHVRERLIPPVHAPAGY